MAKTAALVGEKLGMTQVWDESNRIVPVTVLRVSPARVVQIRTPEKDGYSALQVTYGHRDARKLTKPLAGHYAKGDVDPGVRLVELRLDDISAYEVGQTLDADTFAAPDDVVVLHPESAEVVHGRLPDFVFGQTANEITFQPVIGQRHSNIGFAAAVSDIKLLRLHKPAESGRGKPQHNFPKCYHF